MSFTPPRLYHLAAGIVSACAFSLFSTLAPAYAEHDHEKDLTQVADPGSTTPRFIVPEYRSPISDYLPFEDADPLDWKEANDRVGEIGGWRVYSREAFESDDTEDEEMDSK